MKIAYLMIVHKDPQLLTRAIGTLSCEGCGFFVHIDRKADNGKFSGTNVETIWASERIPVHWGEFSQVRAATVLMRQALKCTVEYDYLVLLTGSTYPLRSGKYIQAFLQENRGWEFISMVKMPAPAKPLFRINTLRFPSNQPFRRFASRALAKVGLAQRDYKKHLGGLQPYSGGGSWALSRNACRYLLEFMGRSQHVERYFEDTFAPDEMFFHTILGNSPFRSRIRRDLLYDLWPDRSPHPAMISTQHVQFFEAQDKVWVEDMYGSGEALFARKFSDERLDLVDRIDEMISRKEQRDLARVRSWPLE